MNILINSPYSMDGPASTQWHGARRILGEWHRVGLITTGEISISIL